MSMTTENQKAVPLVDELAIEASLVESGITSKRLPTVLRMAEASLRAQGVPDGWRLVPVEPTGEMQSAWDSSAFNEDSDEEWRGAYRAMISAAPRPQGEEHGG